MFDVVEVRKMIEVGVEIECMILEDKCMNLFCKNVERRLGDGSGSVDIEAFTGILVEDFKIDGEKVKIEFKNIVVEKKCF